MPKKKAPKSLLLAARRERDAGKLLEYLSLSLFGLRPLSIKRLACDAILPVYACFGSRRGLDCHVLHLILGSAFCSALRGALTLVLGQEGRGVDDGHLVAA